MTPTPTVAEVLRDAAQRIRTNGWFGQNVAPAVETECVMLAVSRAVNCSTNDSCVFADALEFMHLQGGGNVYHWNDTVCRDGAEAAESLEKWAALWEEQGSLGGTS